MNFDKDITRKKNFLYQYALDSLENINAFTNFVAYTENLFQDDELFPNEDSKEKYQEIWWNLEIINALALEELDNSKYPNILKNSIIWKNKYKKMAKKEITIFLNAIKNVGTFNINLNKNNIHQYALDSIRNVKHFARFVRASEYLFENDELFPSEESKKHYQDLWFNELEIINILALFYWKKDDYPDPITWDKWQRDYKEDAKKGIQIFLNFLKIYNYKSINTNLKTNE